MSGVKQFRINDVVEAIQYDGYNQEEINEFLNPYHENPFDYLDPKPNVYDWVVKNLYGGLLIVPCNLFDTLYTQVHS